MKKRGRKKNAVRKQYKIKNLKKIKKSKEKNKNKFLYKILKKYKNNISLYKINIKEKLDKKLEYLKKLTFFRKKKANKLEKEIKDFFPSENIKLNDYQSYFDALLELIKKKNVITLSKVVKEFNISNSTANEWGRILSENGLIDFYVPVWGEPEFRKKGLKIKKRITPRKKINLKVYLIPVALILILLLTFFIKNYFVSKERSAEIVEEKILESKELKEAAEIEKPGVDVIEAFSGKGNYECRTKDNKIKYFIRDVLIKIENLEDFSKIIIKNSKIYTYNVESKKWIESELKDGLALPGSGIYPKVKLICKKANVKEKEFETK